MFGVPLVPPGRVASLANGVRRRVLGLHRAAAPPPLVVLEALFAQFDAHVLAALVALDVPDRLARPVTSAELANQLGADPDRLDRLLRYAAARGLVGRDRAGRVRGNGVTRALRRDAPAPWRSWVEFATSDWFGGAWRALPASMDAGAAAPFEAAHGHEFFTHTRLNPSAGVVFDRAMEAGATLQAVGLARALDWGETRSVCDVGGGTGVALEVLQRYEPQLDVTLFDLPEVVARALVTAPRLLVADEPTSHQDEANTQRVVEALEHAAHGGGVVLLSTHDPRVVERCDRVVRLLDGRVTDVGD